MFFLGSWRYCHRDKLYHPFQRRWTWKPIFQKQDPKMVMEMAKEICVIPQFSHLRLQWHTSDMYEFLNGNVDAAPNMKIYLLKQKVKIPKNAVFGFHGTSRMSAFNILRYGFDPTKRNLQAYGAGLKKL